MKTIIFLLLSFTSAFSQSYIDSLAAYLKNLETRVAALEAGSGGSGAQLSAQRLTLNPGGAGVAELKMVGLGARSFSLKNEQGHANLYLYGNPGANETKLFSIKDNNSQSVFDFDQAGGLKFYKFPVITRPSISQTKYYYLLVLDETGKTVPVRVRGRWLYNTLITSE